MAPTARPERLPARLRAAWRALGREQRRVLIAALVLLATMFLPWYSKSVDAVVGGKLASQSSAKLAITVFSWVEAAIFLVAVGIAALILARGERRAFHLPGGDGLIVVAGGAWATFLVFYRFVDKPSGGGGGSLRIEYGLSWGIFFGLLAALALMVSGLRLRAAHVAEPALPGDVAPSSGPLGTAEPTLAERRREREARRAARSRPAPDAAATVVDPRPASPPRGPDEAGNGERRPAAGKRRPLPGPAADAPVRESRAPRDEAATTADPPQLPFDQRFDQEPS